MKLKSVTFLQTVKSPKSTDEYLTYPPPVAQAGYTVETEGSLIRLTSMNKEGIVDGVVLVPMAQVRAMVPVSFAESKRA